MDRKVLEVQQKVERNFQISRLDNPQRLKLKDVWNSPEKVARFVEEKAGVPIVDFDVEDLGRTYPHKNDPFKHDLYSVKLKNGIRVRIERQYGNPNWKDSHIIYVNKLLVLPN